VYTRPPPRVADGRRRAAAADERGSPALCWGGSQPDTGAGLAPV